jgi:c-di-GMP phosphodiesterase
MPCDASRGGKVSSTSWKKIHVALNLSDKTMGAAGTMKASLSKLAGAVGWTPAEEDLSICVGRQPIYDANRNVGAFELLFRTPGAGRAEFRDGDEATAQVIWNSLVEIGLDRIAGTEPVFINCTRHFLEQPPLLPPDRCVLEVLEDIHLDDRLLEAAASLRRRGYHLALDDLVFRDGVEPLLELSTYVKVDVAACSDEELPGQVARLRPFGKILLAEKVESGEQLKQCQRLGFELFQGYFLRHPDTVHGRRAPVNNLSTLCLIAECRSPDSDLAKIARVIQTDLTLSYKLLQVANSALYGLRVQIQSIRHAVTVLGAETMLRWATLLVMAGFKDCPSAYLGLALQRARACELLAEATGRSRPDRFYTTGLFSLLDAMLRMPMEEIVPPLPLADDIQTALLTHDGELGGVLRHVLSYEEGVWSPREPGGPAPAVMQQVFWEAVAYANQANPAVQKRERRNPVEPVSAGHPHG